MSSRKADNTINVRVTVPGCGYKKHAASASATLVGEVLVVQLGDGATVEILPRLEAEWPVAVNTPRIRRPFGFSRRGKAMPTSPE